MISMISQRSIGHQVVSRELSDLMTLQQALERSRRTSILALERDCPSVSVRLDFEEVSQAYHASVIARSLQCAGVQGMEKTLLKASH